MSNTAFKVYERNAKTNQKKLRNSGQVPGIIYGEFLDDSIPVQMCNAELKRMLRKNNSGSIIEVNLENKKFNCVVKEIQKNNLHEIVHVDFQYTKANEVIKMRIPIKYIGQDSLHSKRLILESHNSFIDLQGDVEKIPEYIEIDVSDMNFDDKKYIKDICIPEDILVLTDPDTLLAIISN